MLAILDAQTGNRLLADTGSLRAAPRIEWTFRRAHNPLVLAPLSGTPPRPFVRDRRGRCTQNWQRGDNPELVRGSWVQDARRCRVEHPIP